AAGGGRQVCVQRGHETSRLQCSKKVASGKGQAERSESNHQEHQDHQEESSQRRTRRPQSNQDMNDHQEDSSPRSTRIPQSKQSRRAGIETFFTLFAFFGSPGEVS